MCKSPKKLFKSAGKAIGSVVSGGANLLKDTASVALPALGYAVGGPVGGAIGGVAGSAISGTPRQAAQADPTTAPVTDPTAYLQEQTQASAAAAEAARRKRRGGGAATPSFLTQGANRGIITGGASLLGGGSA